MQKSIPPQKIREILLSLRTNLPERPTVVNSLYSLPAEFVVDVLQSNYSQSSLQKISDHIGYYLGILKSVKITFVEERADNKWVSASDGVVTGGTSNSPISGLYKTIGFDHSEILLVKKCKYKLKHVLAILAHEYTHNYLYHHNINRPTESENEILTDLTAAYLGLGHLLIQGYKPISWAGDYWNFGFYHGYTAYTLSIGYVTPKTIRRAIVISAELRNWNPKEVIAAFPSFWDKIIAFFQLITYRKKFKKTEKEKRQATIIMKKRDEQIKSLKKDIDEVSKIYTRVCELIKIVSTKASPLSIPAEDGRMLVEIASKISIGETEFEIRSISEKINSLEKISANNEDISQLHSRISELKKTIIKWSERLQKYE